MFVRVFASPRRSTDVEPYAAARPTVGASYCRKPLLLGSLCCVGFIVILSQAFSHKAFAAVGERQTIFSLL